MGGRSLFPPWKRALIISCLFQLAHSSTFPPYAIDHAPLLWLHSDDPYMPSDIARHVFNTAPRIAFEPISAAMPLLNLDNLSLLNQYGNDGTEVFLTAIGDVSNFPEWVFGEIPDETGALHNSMACAVVSVEHETSDKQNVVDVFYFYFYSWNEGADITQVVPPLNRLFPDSKPGDHFGNHLGDWEHSMIRFIDEKPVGVYFSQHTSGESCLWDDTTCLSKQGERPLVYSARGSHANYPSEGHHVHDEALIDIADKGRLWDPVKRAYFYTYDFKTETFAVAEPGAAPVDWLYFNGNWGDQRYTNADKRQHTIPYFGLKKFDNGPNGPKFKHLVRQGLEPDQKPKTPLMKTLVHWYMGWYGCCLRGVNPWVVVMFFMVALAVSIVVCVCTSRWLRPFLKRQLLGRKMHAKEETSEVQLRLLEGAEEPDDEP